MSQLFFGIPREYAFLFFHNNRDTATTATGISSTSAYQYTGRENDGTGLYYYRARYYHPVLQRFISEDPIEFAGGDVNFYAYVGGNPINDRDPTGEIAPLAALALPFAIPAFVKVGAFIGSAVAAGYLASKVVYGPAAVGPLTPEKAAEKEAEHKAYHRRCDASPPGGLDECAEAKWILRRNIDCLQMRLAWEQKWQIFHPDEIAARRAAITNAEEMVKRYCKCKS